VSARGWPARRGFPCSGIGTFPEKGHFRESPVAEAPRSAQAGDGRVHQKFRGFGLTTPYRARRKAAIAAEPTKPPAVIRYRRPADRRTRSQQWADAVQTLAHLLDRFQKWRDNLPASLENSATAEALDAVLALRGYVDELQAVDLPKGFGRD